MQECGGGGTGRDWAGRHLLTADDAFKHVSWNEHIRALTLTLDWLQNDNHLQQCLTFPQSYHCCCCSIDSRNGRREDEGVYVEPSARFVRQGSVGEGGGQERRDWHAAIYIWIIGVNKHRVKVWKRKNKMGNFVNTAVTVSRSVSL